MTDAEELAVLREFAEKSGDRWVCLGDFFVGKVATQHWVARRIGTDDKRAVAFWEGSLLAEDSSLGKCILAARAKLAAERDAKDAPRLREENERYRKALEEIRRVHLCGGLD
jgi:hypothetical protein